MYLPPQARFSYLLRLPEGENIGKAINDAMKAIEAENEELRGVLPTNYTQLNNDTLVALLKTFSEIPMDIEGDIFGKIYEYFLGKFAMSEGQKGGEFFTPTSIVKLIVEIIEPFQGRSLTRHVVPAVCSYRAPVSCRTTSRTPAPTSPSTVRRRPPDRAPVPNEPGCTWPFRRHSPGKQLLRKRA